MNNFCRENKLKRKKLKNKFCKIELYCMGVVIKLLDNMNLNAIN